jgi:uncharacterized phage-associated protein
MKRKVEIGKNGCYTNNKRNNMEKYECSTSACSLASYIINERIKLGVPVTNLMLQCLMYYTKGFCLVQNPPCIAYPENILATPYGPVVMSVYNKFIYYKKRVISEFQYVDKTLDGQVLNIINSILRHSVILTQADLVEQTKHEAPWLLTPLYHPMSHEILIAEFEFKTIDDYF